MGSDSPLVDAPLPYRIDLDERGEVGLLTRNIRIQASEDAESSYFGGHIMAMPGYRCRSPASMGMLCCASSS